MSERKYESVPRPPRRLQRAKQEPPSSEPHSVSPRVPDIDRVASGAGHESGAAAHASLLNRAAESAPGRTGELMLYLQRQYGNRYVENVLALANEGSAHNEVQPSVEDAIQSERGGGQNLDPGVRRQMEGSLGANFSNVRIHTDQQSDSMNHALSARAFTTGQDIFFRQGAYDPGSSNGRELIAHELTHVVQQGGPSIRRAMSVSHPQDPHEVEAEQTARAVIQQEHSGSAQRQPEAHKEDEEEKKKHHMTKATHAAHISTDRNEES